MDVAIYRVKYLYQYLAVKPPTVPPETKQIVWIASVNRSQTCLSIGVVGR